MDLDARPGDLLLFRGSNWKSFGIAAATCLPSQWIGGCAPSHAGVVCEYEGRLCIGESTTLCDLPCLVQGRAVKGVQLHPLVDRLKSYQGKSWLLRRSPDCAVTAWQSRGLTEAVLSHIGQEYDYAGLIQSGTIGRYVRFWHPAPDHFICSRFVGTVCRHAGLIGQNTVLVKLTPALIAREWVYEELWMPPAPVNVSAL